MGLTILYINQEVCDSRVTGLKKYLMVLTLQAFQYQEAHNLNFSVILFLIKHVFTVSDTVNTSVCGNDDLFSTTCCSGS